LCLTDPFAGAAAKAVPRLVNVPLVTSSLLVVQGYHAYRVSLRVSSASSVAWRPRTGCGELNGFEASF
jgi:hypothetical protein